MSNNGSNTSNAGGPTSMSNASRGTRVVSAGDWVRLKRLQGARTNGYSSNGLLNPTSPIFNKDVAPVTSLQVPYGLPIHVFPVAGSSKIRRAASNWTDHIAFKNADVVFSNQVSPDNATTVLTRYRLCDCTKTNLADKDVICRKCLTRTPQGQQQITDMDGPGGGGGDRITIDWVGQDANDGSEAPLCYGRSGPSLPYIFDPCLEESSSFSFSFSNLLNIGNVTNVILYATTSLAGPYDFSLFTLSNVSISGGGTIISAIGDSSNLNIRVSGLTSSSVITLTIPVGDRQGLCSLDDICIASVIPIPPVADFRGEPTIGFVPLTVAFTDDSTGGPTSWLWDFKNNGSATSTLQNPSYTYTTVGLYTVKLTATNSAGSDDLIRTDYIDVQAVIPPGPTPSGSPTFSVTTVDGVTPVASQYFVDYATGTTGGSSFVINIENLPTDYSGTPLVKVVGVIISATSGLILADAGPSTPSATPSVYPPGFSGDLLFTFDSPISTANFAFSFSYTSGSYGVNNVTVVMESF